MLWLEKLSKVRVMQWLFSFNSISHSLIHLEVWIDWVKTSAPSGFVAKYCTTFPWLIGVGSVHISINSHPIMEGEVLSCCLLNRSCRTLWDHLWWTCWMLGTLFRALNGLLLVFLLPFFLQHGKGGGKVASKQFKWMQNIYWYKFPFDFWANLRHLGWLASATQLIFITPYCINMPKGYAVCIMQKTVDLDRNQLCYGKNLCIIWILHYSICIIVISTVYRIPKISDAICDICANFRDVCISSAGLTQ